jgi:uncharacterized protein (DUF433 family)
MKRIPANPSTLGGKPIVRGMRISVELILSLLAQGETKEEILKDFPGLEVDDIRACIGYAPAVIGKDILSKDLYGLAGSLWQTLCCWHQDSGRGRP